MENMDTDVKVYSEPGSLSCISVSEKPEVRDTFHVKGDVETLSSREL